jgi:hypothetical protein
MGCISSSSVKFDLIYTLGFYRSPPIVDFNIMYLSCIFYRWNYGIYNVIGKLLSAMHDVFDNA